MTAAEIIDLVHERDRLLARIAEIDAAIGGAVTEPTSTLPPIPTGTAGASADERQQYVAPPSGRRKRPHGAGSVFHRGGLWSIRWLDETGARRFLSGIETEERAEKALDEMIAKRTDALLRRPLVTSQKRSEAGRRNVAKRWGKADVPAPPVDTVAPPAPAPVPAHRLKGQRICQRCGEPGHFANGPFHPEAARAKRLPVDAKLPPYVTPAEAEPPDERPEVTLPPDDDDPADATLDISAQSNWKPRTVRPPLIRNDDPSDRPIIVDVGGVDVVTLEVSPATKTTTRVHWQSDPSTWSARRR